MSLKPVPGQSSSVLDTKTVPWIFHECRKTDDLEALGQSMFMWKSIKISLHHHLNPQWSVLQVWWTWSCQMRIGFYLQDSSYLRGYPESCSVSLKAWDGVWFLLNSHYPELRWTDHPSFSLWLTRPMSNVNRCHEWQHGWWQMSSSLICSWLKHKPSFDVLRNVIVMMYDASLLYDGPSKGPQ